MNHLSLAKVAGKANLADLMAKFVSSTQHKQLIKLFGLHGPNAGQKSLEQLDEEEGDGRSDDEHDAEIEISD